MADPIKDDAEHAAALEELESMMRLGRALSPKDLYLIDNLTDEVLLYEKRRWPEAGMSDDCHSSEMLARAKQLTASLISACVNDVEEDRIMQIVCGALAQEGELRLHEERRLRGGVMRGMVHGVLWKHGIHHDQLRKLLAELQDTDPRMQFMTDVRTLISCMLELADGAD